MLVSLGRLPSHSAASSTSAPRLTQRPPQGHDGMRVSPTRCLPEDHIGFKSRWGHSRQVSNEFTALGFSGPKRDDAPPVLVERDSGNSPAPQLVEFPVVDASAGRIAGETGERRAVLVYVEAHETAADVLDDLDRRYPGAVARSTYLHRGHDGLVRGSARLEVTT